MIDWLKSMEQTYEYYVVDPGTWKDSKKLNNVKSATIKRDSSVETLGSASFDVTETVGEFYSNAATASLDDLIGLYETIHGENSFAESGLLDDYQHAVTEAKKGNVKILQSFLENLVKEAQA